jgi:Reverse transcriptase (RNA-dependent DNA polymerase)
LIGGTWAEDDIPGLEEDCDDLEQILVAETADAEALEPRSLAEACRRLEWVQWEQAIKEEIATLKAAGTWRLEELPPGVNVISSKWVFKAKKDASGWVVCYKACLVVQGFSQIDGVDYDDTYAPVARLASMCAILMLANQLDMELQQFDVKAAYLNGELTGDEVLFMHHPLGYN